MRFRRIHQCRSASIRSKAASLFDRKAENQRRDFSWGWWKGREANEQNPRCEEKVGGPKSAQGEGEAGEEGEGKVEEGRGGWTETETAATATAEKGKEGIETLVVWC